MGDPLDAIFLNPEEIERKIAIGELIDPSIKPDRTPVEEAIFSQYGKVSRRKRTILDHIATYQEELTDIDKQLGELKEALETLRKENSWKNPKRQVPIASI